MKIQETVKRETIHIALGTAGLCVVMNGIFALVGQWELSVLWGSLLGGGWGVVNFFLLALTVQRMSADPNEQRGKLTMRLSYSLRMLATLVVVVLAVKLPQLHWIPAVLGLFFPRLTILIMQMTGMYTPPKKDAENKEGGDDPV